MKKNRGILIISLLFFFWAIPVFAQVQISEIAWMGTKASSYDEWIELYNSGEEKVDLKNWVLESSDGKPHINLTGEIPAKSYFLLERTDDTSVANVEADQIYTGSLSNSGEKLLLKNSKGELVDETPANSWVAGDNSTKKTMERVDFTASGVFANSWQTFQNESSDFLDSQGQVILGSPRSQNSGEIIFPIPENLEFVSDFTEVKIDEINPVSANSREIWLKFSILSDSAVDITNWKIKNANGSQKLSELIDSLVLISDSENLAGKSVHLNKQGLAKISERNLPPNFTISTDRLVFSAKNKGDWITFAVKSEPLSLTDDKVFQIKDSDKLIAERVFAKDLQIFISEISPNNSQNDFIELFVKNSDGLIDLKNLEIRHNGRTIFFAENPLLVQKGDFLTFRLSAEKISDKPRKYRNTTFLQETGDSFIWEKGIKNGIVASSGTVEVILWSGTTWENPAKLADFVCWADKKLNKTETKRLKKLQPLNWNGACFASQKLQKDESIARTEPQTDTNNSRDFYHHLHGSPGEPNFLKNHRPHAKIKLQSGEFRGKSRVNFTGKESDNSASTDGDGLDDLKKFEWRVNGQSCGDFEKDGWNWENENCYLESQKYNPSYMYFDFDNFAEFEISLRVTDLAGFSDTTKIIISREKTETEEQKDKKNSEKTFNYNQDNSDNSFFADFLEKVDLEKLKEIAYNEKLLEPIKPAPRYLFARDKFSAEERSLMAKNIGLIFQ